jgi:phospho-N-acetylmuramoyl-pentapeptide-transferase
MLYFILNKLAANFDFPGKHLINYTTFRSGAAFVLALLIAMIAGRHIIHFLQRRQIGETIRNLGLEGQMSKKGTPTMGGVIIILAILVPCLLVGNLTNVYMLLMIVTTIWLGLIGGLDDYIKVFRHNKEGLKGRFKIIGQVGLGIIVGLTLYLSPDVTIRQNYEVKRDGVVQTANYSNQDIKSTQTTIPFFKNNNLDYADFAQWAGDHAQEWGWVFFVVLTIFIVTAVSNGANVTDGLDGLAAGTSAIIGVTLGILAYLSSNVEYASYLNIMYIKGSQEIVVFASAFIGALIGFIWYNAYPAQVFMGDTGSLTIGGIIAVMAIAIHKELLLPILCGVYFVESISVIAQVSYFKYTKKKYGEGRRILRMAPLHHHFQKSADSGIAALIQRPHMAIPESKIVTRFWIISILLAALTIVTLKIR